MNDAADVTQMTLLVPLFLHSKAPQVPHTRNR